MASNLMPVDGHLQRLPIQDADVFYLRRVELSRSHAEILQWLIAEVPWRAEEVMVWGRTVLQPRLTAWYGDAGRSYAYSGILLRPLPWTPLLLEIKRSVEAVAGSAFNSVLLNYYRDNRDSIGFHSDDERELGLRPVIGSLSLGAERILTFKHKRLKQAEPVRLRLPSGSLLLMCGKTQDCWRHGIAKESRPCGPRVNLTFRAIID